MQKLDLQAFAEEAAEAAAVEAAAEDRTEAAIPSEAEAVQEAPARYQGMEPVLDALARRFGVEAGDGAALLKAMDQQYAALEQRRMEQGAGRIYDGWIREAEQLKQLYPAFDLGKELLDPRFAGLLRSRVDLRTAFEVTHSRELLPAAMEYAARAVEQRLTSALGTGQFRPAENGLRSSGAVMVGSDISGMSRQEYDRVCRRIERGERVSFG